MDAGSVAPKEADPTTSMQVDTMILEYLCYNSTKGLLAERRATKRSETLLQADKPDLPLSMIDAFLPMFRVNHAAETPHQSLQLRIRILRFTTLFTRRYTPNQATPPFEELQLLRNVQRDRAIAWYGDMPLDQVCRAIGVDTSRSQSSISAVWQARETVCQQLSIPQEATAFYTSPSSVSLLDLLPMFLAVAASSNELQGGNMTRQLQELAASFMQQAVLEQFLIFGSQEYDVIAEAFAWGYRQTPPTVWEDEELVNEMFCDEDMKEEVEGWADMHERFLNDLKANERNDAKQQLADLFRRMLMTDFEDQVLDFIGQMLEALPTPDLNQLEAGQLAGKSRQQTEDFKQRVRYHDI